MKTSYCRFVKMMVVVAGALLISPQAWSGESPAWNPPKKIPLNPKPPKKEIISTQPVFETMGVCDPDGDGFIEDELIPDPLLRSIIKEKMGISAKGQIPVGKAKQLKDIYVVKEHPLGKNVLGKFSTSHSIPNLGGLECFSGLIKLTVQNHSLSNLDPLAKLTNLEFLDLRYNEIGDLTPLVGLTNLKQLNLEDNNTSNLEPLSKLTNLDFLDLRDNKISNLTPLAGLTNLKQLNLNGKISNITPLAKMTKLERLWLCGNNINDLAPLSELTKLERLCLGGNNINDFAPLQELKELEWLFLGSSNINDLAPLQELKELEWLWLSGNNIKELAPLSELTKLKGLVLRVNNINDLTPLQGLKALEYLDLGYNHNITDITPLLNNGGLGDYNPHGGFENDDNVYLVNNPNIPSSQITQLMYQGTNGVDVHLHYSDSAYFSDY